MEKFRKTEQHSPKHSLSRRTYRQQHLRETENVERHAEQHHYHPGAERQLAEKFLYSANQFLVKKIAASGPRLNNKSSMLRPGMNPSSCPRTCQYGDEGAYSSKPLRRKESAQSAAGAS